MPELRVRPLVRRRVRVSVVAGLTLVSSGAVAGDLVPPKVLMVTPTGINIATSTFTFSNTDLSIGTIAVERFYSGSPEELRDPDTMFHGIHQSSGFDIFVTPAFTRCNNCTAYARPQVHLGSSSSGMFQQTQFTGTTVFFPTDTIDAYKGQLRLVNSAYEYTDSSGTVYLFNPAVQVAGVLAASYSPYSQRIASITYPDGRVRSFSYVNGQLKLVSDTSGYAVVFDYGANGLISAACGFNQSQTYVTSGLTCAGAPLKATYSYATDPTTSMLYLQSFTDPLNQITNYSYQALGVNNLLMSCVKPPGYASCKLANVWASHGVTQTLADQSVWSAAASAGIKGTDTDNGGIPDGNVNASFSGPNQNTSFVFTGTSPYSMTDANNQTTQYSFTGGNTMENEAAGYPDVHVGSILESITLPEGNEYLLESNGPFLLPTKETWKAKPGSGPADVVVQYGYGSGTIQQTVHPIWVKDANNNQTDYTYATHGGQLSEMKPAPSAGAARPLKLTTWVQKYAYVKNSAGALVPAAAPIWVISTETECQTVAGSSSTVCDSTAPQKVTSYQYGADGTANNLNVRGIAVAADGSTRRTCYTYDNYGNKISQTQPRASLSVCP